MCFLGGPVIDGRFECCCIAAVMAGMFAAQSGVVTACASGERIVAAEVAYVSDVAWLYDYLLTCDSRFSGLQCGQRC